MRTVRLIVHGRVQGVGFRHFVANAARRIGLDGWVRNRLDGTVEVLARGSLPAVEELIAECHKGPPASIVGGVAVAEADEVPPQGFRQTETV